MLMGGNGLGCQREMKLWSRLVQEASTTRRESRALAGEGITVSSLSPARQLTSTQRFGNGNRDVPVSDGARVVGL